jgi:hypothetical protein
MHLNNELLKIALIAIIFHSNKTRNKAKSLSSSWILDLGVNHHYYNNIDVFTSLVPISEVVTMADGSIETIIGQGLV